MNTWYTRMLSCPHRFLHPILVSLILMLSIMAQPEAAYAERCSTYHWVQLGQTTAYIAHTYGFKWREIAEYNGLNVQDELEPGTRLCIPPVDKTEKPKLPKSEPAAQISVFVNGDRVYITVDDYGEAHEYRVKARSTKAGVGGWHNLGMMIVLEKAAQNYIFDLPGALRDLPTVNICLKDLVNNELICRRAKIPR